jgi:hypothetical protein
MHAPAALRRGKNSGHPLTGTLVGPHRRSGRFEQEKILTSLPSIGTPYLYFPARNVANWATGVLSIRLYGVTSQEAVVFIVTAVKNLNGTKQIITRKHKVVQSAD